MKWISKAGSETRKWVKGAYQRLLSVRSDKEQVFEASLSTYFSVYCDYLFLIMYGKTECMKTDISLCARFCARCIRLWQFVDELVAEAAVNAGHGLV